MININTIVIKGTYIHNIVPAQIIVNTYIKCKSYFTHTETADSYTP